MNGSDPEKQWMRIELQRLRQKLAEAEAALAQVTTDVALYLDDLERDD